MPQHVNLSRVMLSITGRPLLHAFLALGTADGNGPVHAIAICAAWPQGKEVEKVGESRRSSPVRAPKEFRSQRSLRTARTRRCVRRSVPFASRDSTLARPSGLGLRAQPRHDNVGHGKIPGRFRRRKTARSRTTQLPGRVDEARFTDDAVQAGDCLQICQCPATRLWLLSWAEPNQGGVKD